jgi:glycosyltransferase involved in cell wall biosynthesis
MKVLILIESISGGGAARVASYLADNWHKRGSQVTFVTLSNNKTDFYMLDDNIKRFALDLNCESSNLLLGVKNNISRVLATRKILKLIKPDIAIGFQDTANILLVFSKTVHKDCSYIGSVRNYPPMNRLSKHWHLIRKYSYKYLDSIVTLTKECSNWIEKYTNAKDTTVIPNPIIWPLPKMFPLIPPKKQTNKQTKRILAVGSLVHIKGFDLLISAFSAFIETNQNWELVIIGEGRERRLLEELVQELGLSNKVYFIGKVGNVSDWYEVADVFVLSSRSEGFPGVLVEAMASGLPVISFDCNTGPRDIITNDLNGILIKPESKTALKEAMCLLANNENLRKSLSSNAIKIRDTLSMETISLRWDELFEKHSYKVRHSNENN